MLGDLERLSLTVTAGDGARTVVRVEGPGDHPVGPLVVTVAESATGWRWSVAVAGDQPVPVTSVALGWDAGPAGADPRLFCNGYQSWSPTAVRRLGVDTDPSATPGAPALLRGMHAADPSPSPAGELRSDLVTVLDRGTGPLLLAGFLAGTDHDGTFRATLAEGRVVLAAEAYLGGAVLQPGECRPLHDVVLGLGEGGDAPELLEGWAADAGAVGRARVGAPYQVGWCSWYQYFHDVSEDVLRANLARAGAWPFTVFQLDDGYQPAVGDWLATNDRFPTPLDGLAAAVAGHGLVPGIWLAPFVAAPTSAVATAHPDWIVEHRPGAPLVGMVNPGWGGPVHVLDTTDPGVLAHLEDTAAALVDAGFPYLKLDFTYAPSLPGRYADPTRTPAQRVRASMEAVRRGAGDDAFLLGCGLPLGAGIGLVDGMRIGPDVAPRWAPPAGGPTAGYEEALPATENAWRNTLTRSFLHRRLWLNDPDCVMLRGSGTDLPPAAARAWALAVGVSGGMALLSDDLGRLDAEARALFDEVLALGQAADAAARTGPPARCPDILEAGTPSRLSAAGRRVVGVMGGQDGSVTAKVTKLPLGGMVEQ